MFNKNTLLNSKRASYKKDLSKNTENAFLSDYKRIITSPAFRRLQDKTQVFPLERNDFVHTRLTHSLEVAMIARELTRKICENNHINEKIFKENKEDICNIVENASLLHDIGNPPFGHFGEDIIRTWFKKNLNRLLTENNKTLSEKYIKDFYHFEGNAQALRIATYLHDFGGENGMDLTYTTLNTILKYYRSSSEEEDSKIITKKKIGYFQSEKDIFNEIIAETGVGTSRHPLTFILEAADDIAYLTADIEDAIKKECVSFINFKEFMIEYCEKNKMHEEKNKHLSEICKNFSKENTNQNFVFLEIRSKLIHAANYTFSKKSQEINNGNLNQDLFKNSHSDTLHSALQSFSIHHIFNNKNILKLEIAGDSIIKFLLDKLIPAVLDANDNLETQDKLHSKLISLISDTHKKAYIKSSKNSQNPEEKLYYRLLMITDFISGMTDSYATNLYLSLSGNKI